MFVPFIYILDYSKKSAPRGLYNLLESTWGSRYNAYFRLYYIDEYMVDKDTTGQFTKNKNGFSASGFSPGLAFCFTNSGEETGGHEMGIAWDWRILSKEYADRQNILTKDSKPIT